MAQSVRINSPGKSGNAAINAPGKSGNVTISAPGSTPPPDPTYQHILIVYLGESNSGGQALNVNLTSAELAVRSGVQIFNNNSLVFESLDIGTNNALGHTGLATNIYHSWENGLAHQVEDGLMHNPTMLLKCGQGGSTIAQWNEPGAYYTTFKSRMDLAIPLVTTLNGGTAPKIYIWFSLGINDAIALTNVASFKTGVTDLISRIRIRYGTDIVFMMTEIPNAFDTYNTPLYQIASELTRVHMIETSSQPLQGDGRHWTDVGQRGNADGFISTMKANYTF